MGLFFEKDDGAVRERPKPYSTSRGALVASASKLDLGDKRDVEYAARRLKTETWQEDAWEMYDLVGEMNFAANMLADVLSRVRIYPAYITHDSQIPSQLTQIPEEVVAEAFKVYAQDALDLLSTGNGGINGLLRDAALNLFVAGEYYLCKEQAKPSRDIGERWSVRSVSEIQIEAQAREGDSNFFLKPRRNSAKEEWQPISRAENFIARMWRTHPRFSDEADSSIRSILDSLDELLLLNRLARQTAKKRLNAGILFIPDEIDNLYQNDGDLDPDSEVVADLAEISRSFADELLYNVTEPLENEDSAASVMPLLVRGPKELGSMIQHIKIESSMDPAINIRQDKVLDRILAGLAVPKDTVTGLASVKYSNAIMIEETLFKAHIEPMVMMICDQLTTGFLQPLLKLWGVPDDIRSNILFWYDPSAITTKPSKAESASEGFELGVLSGEAWRRAHGFAETDAPSEIEKAWKIAEEKGLISEPIYEAILKIAMPGLTELVRSQQVEQAGPAGQALNDAVTPTAPTAEPNDRIDPEAEPAPTDLVEP